jgi:hypothetical protein
VCYFQQLCILGKRAPCSLYFFRQRCMQRGFSVWVFFFVFAFSRPLLGIPIFHELRAVSQLSIIVMSAISLTICLSPSPSILSHAISNNCCVDVRLTHPRRTRLKREGRFPGEIIRARNANKAPHIRRLSIVARRTNVNMTASTCPTCNSRSDRNIGFVT